MTAVEEFISSRANREAPKRLRLRQKPLQPTVDLLGTETKTKKNKTHGNAYKNTKTKKSLVLGHVIRSTWEYHVALVLKSFDIDYVFEKETFWFPVIRGNKGYLPDFYLTKTDEYIEVKGYLDRNGKIKMKRYKKYFPNEAAKTTIVISKSAKGNKDFFESLGFKILYYEDFCTSYKNKIKYWENII